jgi:hypothetical protein
MSNARATDNTTENTAGRPSEISAIVAAFLDLSLPKPQWTHHAHLCVGLWHVLLHPPAEALVLLRERISRYNAVTGVLNTPTSGYHESITAFYTWQIAWFVETNDHSWPIQEFAAALIARFGAKDLPLTYWTESRLMSSEARLGWLAPDLRPLPPLPKSQWTPR